MISELTDQEKSVALLKAMGWYPVEMPKFHSEGFYRLADADGQWREWEIASRTPEGVWDIAPNLYLPANMALAWRVLNWAADNQAILDSCMEDGFMGDVRDFWELPPADAQRQWLDRILWDIQLFSDFEEEE